MLLEAKDEVLIGSAADPGIWGPPSGILVFQVCIHTRVIPWKAPKTTRHGAVPLKFQSKSYQHWKKWTGQVQDLLRWAFHQTDRGHCPENFFGPDSLDLDMLFVILPGGNPPDRINAGKCVEDLLQGIVYRNDRVVRGGDVRRVFMGDKIRLGEDLNWEGPERMHLRVVAVG